MRALASRRNVPVHCTKLDSNEKADEDSFDDQRDSSLKFLKDKKEKSEDMRAAYATDGTEWTLVTRKSKGTPKPENCGRFLADSGANTHVFTNDHYLQNAVEYNQEVRVGGNRVI